MQAKGSLKKIQARGSNVQSRRFAVTSGMVSRQVSSIVSTSYELTMEGGCDMRGGVSTEDSNFQR